MNKKINSYYDNRVVLKPWGKEHVIFRNSNKLSVTYLNIDYKKSTSLHCHPQKKTGFVILSGKVAIQLGLWKSNFKTYYAPSKLMIRNRLFHSIKSLSKKGSSLIEIETPYNKKDLVRYKDIYGREKKPYEGHKSMKKISKKEIVLNQNINKHVFDNKVEMSLERHKNFKKINKEKIQTIFAILKGNVVDENNRSVLSIGDIIKTPTIKKLSEVFKIKKELTVLKIKKI
jgi:mannose-6-phosphate isomerase-like protein (cupin superfamily)